eukprot:gene18361-biopygen12954
MPAACERGRPATAERTKNGVATVSGAHILFAGRQRLQVWWWWDSAACVVAVCAPYHFFCGHAIGEGASSPWGGGRAQPPNDTRPGACKSLQEILRGRRKTITEIVKKKDTLLKIVFNGAQRRRWMRR